MKYHWVHIDTGRRGTAQFDEQVHPYLTRTLALELVNEWNRVATITSDLKPSYLYWMED